MGRSVRNGSCTIDADDDWEIVQTDIMEDVVQRALQEGGIDGDDGAEALTGKAGREGDGMRFRDSRVEATFRIFIHKFFEPSSLQHGWGNDGQFWMLFRQRCDGLREGIGKRTATCVLFERFTRGDVERGDAVEIVWFRFSGRVAFSFYGQQMEEDWPVGWQFR